MQIDIVNHNNEKIGAIDVRDDVFGGRINGALIWQSVVRANAGDRRGTHKTKNRADVSGTGKKPWKQKGTGRARVGSSRTPLWRKGGTVFGPQPRSYAFTMPKKAELGALRGALAQKLKDGQVVVLEALTASEVKTKSAVAMLKRLGVNGRALLIDVAPDANLSQSLRNIPGVVIVASGRLTARDVEIADRVLTTKLALEKLQEALAS